MKISIIIPTLNEVKYIESTLTTIKDSQNVELIVVDGGSTDGTINLIKNLGISLIISPPGRAIQMNTGALASTGDILLFLHADTRLPPKFDTMIRQTLLKPGVVAGAFSLKIDSELPSFRLVERGVSWRSQLWQMPYGDQAIFMRRVVFQAFGGFPNIQIMEDFQLICHLKCRGSIVTLKTPVVTSARRWLKMGVWQTTLINQVIIIAYSLGISPILIRKWYGRKN